MKALIIALKKIITVMTAVLVPATSATPALVHVKEPVKASTVEVVVLPQAENEDLEIVEQPEDVAPKFVEDQTQNENDNVSAPVEDETAVSEEKFTAVETWDVSATDDDNVTMTFYDTEDTAALLEQLAGKVTALFTPMVAYAAEGREEHFDENGFEVTDGNSSIVYDKDGLVNSGDSDYGSTGRSNDQYEVVPGTVVVSGTGDMMDYVYNYFISPEKYVATMQKLFKECQGLDVTPIYDKSLTDIVDIDATIKWEIVGQEGKYAEYTDEMFDKLNPADMLKFVPEVIIVEEGVTSISECAFACCSDIKTVVLPESVHKIGASAFEYCKGLETLEIKGYIDEIGYGAFNECTSLKTITLHKGYNDAFSYELTRTNAQIVYVNDEN